jgi:hypothetical protein
LRCACAQCLRVFLQPWHHSLDESARDVFVRLRSRLFARSIFWLRGLARSPAESRPTKWTGEPGCGDPRNVYAPALLLLRLPLHWKGMLSSRRLHCLSCRYLVRVVAASCACFVGFKLCLQSCGEHDRPF